MAGIPIPSYSSAVSSLPRLRGDGMDSDTLRTKSILPLNGSPPNPPPQRRRNLNSSTKAATIAKAQRPRHVPREPIKGAVGQMNGLPLDTRTPFPGGGALGGGRIEHTQARIPAKLPDNFVAPGRESLPSTKSSNVTSAVLLEKIGGNVVPRIQPPVSMAVELDNSLIKKPLHEYSYIRMNNVQNNKQTSGINSTAQYMYNSTESIKVPLNQDKIVFSQVNSDQRLSKNVYSENTSSSLQLNALGSKKNSLVKFQIGETCIDMGGKEASKSELSKGNEVVIAMDPPPEEERQVEGQSLPNEDVSKIQVEVKALSEQLQQQVKVNTDLKKLLVASVGDDLHWKMDALIQTKTQLGTEICDYTKKIEKDYEELDKLSIQADMWRSKFMATRVLIDQLASEKEKLSTKWSEAEKALQQLMSERQQLHENMVESHRYLKLLRDSFDPVFARKTESIIPNILELARTNLLLSEAVKFKLLGSLPVLSVALDAGIQNGLTPAEKLAYQALVDWEQPHRTHLAPGRLSAQTLNHFGRFHPQVKYEGIACTHCRNCKGEIQVV